VTANGKLAPRLDPIIHPITRLSICGLLASGADWLEFAALRDAAGISDSVLSKQSRFLEEAGYVEVKKGAVGRRPRTWFRLTPNGREAFQAHVAWLQQAAHVPPDDAAGDTAAPAPSAVHAANERG
jgi:DNA-binding MarR family transcriptional regulator